LCDSQQPAELGPKAEKNECWILQNMGKAPKESTIWEDRMVPSGEGVHLGAVLLPCMHQCIESRGFPGSYSCSYVASVTKPQLDQGPDKFKGGVPPNKDERNGTPFKHINKWC
jgi:hypothetical protein